MDTISRENNSYLPVAGVIVGVLALILSGVALAKVSSAKKEISASVQAEIGPRLDEVSTEARNAGTAAEGARGASNKLASEVNTAFQQVATEIGSIRGELVKIQETKTVKAAPGAAAGGSKEPAVAGPGEYVIKAGDTGAKISRSQGVSLGDLQTVNPGTNWTALKVGQKIKLPAKK